MAETSDINRFKTAVNKIQTKQGQRFMTKRASGFSGWDMPEANAGMLRRAQEKLKALASNKSESPLKDAADVCNFVAFFYNNSD